MSKLFMLDVYKMGGSSYSKTKAKEPVTMSSSGNSSEHQQQVSWSRGESIQGWRNK